MSGVIILIMTIVSMDGVTVHSVQGFINMQACYEAGEIWRKEVPRIRGVEASAACVQTR